MDEIKKLYDRKDFDETYIRLRNDIKIRKYKNLNDLPEINELPSKVQTTIRSAATNLNFYYETVVDEGWFSNKAYVVVFDQGKENWMGMFEYSYATTAVKIGGIIGAGVCVAGVWYYSGAIAEYVNSVIGYISQNYANLQNSILKYAEVLFSVATFIAFRKWLLNEQSEWKMLITACILKKLQSVRGY